MKNFRKVLALVLVVATLFSFAAMTSAKTYEDADKISYTEAVEVLSALEILNGYEDDTFKPTNTISREEMAKMIAVLANAGDDVSKLYASANAFADVENDRWSASYIAYCAQTGIVAGRTADTFDPTGKVTGLETAKMLLVTLGFSAEEQGYVGANWKINVLRDAKNVGLLDNFAAGFNADVAITREEAAQMMLNALEANVVVGVLSENIIKITNAVYGEFKGYTLIDANKLGWTKLYGNVIIADETLAEALFGLTKVDANDQAADCYMRPATGWSWVDAKGNVISFGGYGLKPVFSSVDTTSEAVEKFLKTYNLDKYTTTYYTNGLVDAQGLSNMGGKGVQVEIYEIGTELRVIQIMTYFGQIDEVDTYDKTVTIEGIEYKNDQGFKTADEEKYVLYWICNGACDADHDTLHAAEFAKVANTAVVTKAAWDHKVNENSYFVAGQKYEYARTFNYTILDSTVDYMGNGGYGVGEKFDIYTDKNGFTMYYAPVVEKIEYKYAVVDLGSANAFFNKYNKVDGGEWTYEVAMVEFQANPAVGAPVAASEAMFDRVDNSTKGSDTLVKYYIDADGVACVDGTVNVNREYVAHVDLEADDTILVDGKWLSEDTQILIRVLNPMNGKHEYKYFNGCDELDAVYEVDNMAYYFDGNYMTYVYGEATYAHSSGAAYIMDNAESVLYLTDGNKVVGYNTYDALVDGKEAVIATDEQIITEFNKVYDLTWVRIGLTTDDKAPVYIVTKNTANEIGADAVGVNTLSIDKYGKLFYGNTYTEKKADKNISFIFFAPDWADEYFTVSAAELPEYVSNWDHFDVWAFDTDADKDIDLVYVNAGDGDH